MAQGRCAGCGYSASCAQVGSHILTCPDYLALYRADPEKCLGPEAEHQRHKQENTSEAQAERRDRRLGDRYDEMDRLREKEVARWRKPDDLLEE